MDAYISEAEQIEQIRRWWQKYGMVTVIGIVIVIAATLGWRYWEQRHERMLTKASVLYERMSSAVANRDDETMRMNANRLIDHYRHTPYAELAALMLAREAVYDGKLDVAETKLKWIMKHGDNKALRQVARIRVARVLLAENKPEEALKILEKVDNEAYLASIKEAMGDIFLAMGKPKDAQKAYDEAFDALPGMDVMQPLLQMKIDNL